MKEGCAQVFETFQFADFNAIASVGAFWFGLMMIILFSVTLRWLPSQGVLSVGAEIAILAAMGIIFLVGARLALSYLEQLARREGRLTLKWQ